MCERDQIVHQGKLARMIELEARYAVASCRNGRFSQFAQLTAVDESLQDILLNVPVVLIDA